jgi:deoxyribodipyrimidine photolyase-related protein
LPVEIRADARFFATRARFQAWAKGRQGWRMEHFYRKMRREHRVLMLRDQPAGGAWNFDAENRNRLPAGLRGGKENRAGRLLVQRPDQK